MSCQLDMTHQETDPKVLSAITACIALVLSLEHKKETCYVPRKNRSWKTLSLQEAAWNFSLRR